MGKREVTLHARSRWKQCPPAGYICFTISCSMMNTSVKLALLSGIGVAWCKVLVYLTVGVDGENEARIACGTA